MLKDKLGLFGFKIQINAEVEIPQEAYDPSRKQYECGHFLSVVRKYPGDKVLGVTEMDLYSGNLNFQFGQAEMSGKAAVISLARLKGEKEIYHKRVLKEAVHELGHTFGIDHCEDSETCVMRFSNCLAETDMKEEAFCGDCNKLLEHKLKFN
jgi:archaemetzincin